MYRVVGSSPSSPFSEEELPPQAVKLAAMAKSTANKVKALINFLKKDKKKTSYDFANPSEGEGGGGE